MPRVKFDYVVSFSSEDPDNQANNLLATEISKKKWLCSKGETSCSIVLQMNKAVKISAVHIGAYQASLVEVLVGRSETPNEPYQVLVASNVFLSPSESRREQSVERVRSFTADQLSSPARDKRWDRLRVVCSQPYNKQCKYGLSFVHVFEPEDTEASRCPVIPSRLLNLDTFSSDEDDFRPGELFAKHLENSQDNGSGISNTTEVQIRQATSQALKNLSDSATKLKKTPLPKPAKRSNVDSDQSNTNNRHRESLLYVDDDKKPNSKVDRVIERHSNNKIKDEFANVNKATLKDNKMNEKMNPELNVNKQDRRKDKQNIHNRVDEAASNRTPNSKKDENKTTFSDKKLRVKENRKRTHSDTKQDSTIAAKAAGTIRAGPVSSNPHELLSGVVLVLSGYVNPQRARLRTTALALGALCRPDWGADCTHLICAFPSTPKLKQVRAGPGGGAVPVARGDWLEQCAARRRLLPWQWFATEDSRRVTPQELDDDDINMDSECDTDDEIEKVLQKQKKQRLDKSPQQKHTTRREKPRDESRDRSRDQSRDRVARNEDEGARTEPDTDAEDNLQIDESKALPGIFDGLTFVVARDVTECGGDVMRQVERYVRAYGGLLLDEVQVSEGCHADYVVCVSGAGGGGGGGSRAVRPDWLWKCHAGQKLCPHDEYLYA